MKLWLDDYRRPPFGFDWVKTADDAIKALSTGKYTTVSLDHDLCEAHYAGLPTSVKTGYDVVRWMVQNHVWPQLVMVHSMSPSGVDRMLSLLTSCAPGNVTVRRVVPADIHSTGL